MKVTAVTQAVAEQQLGIAVDQGKVNDLISLLDPMAPLIESLVEHPAYPQEELSLDIDALGSGGWLLLRAGQVSKLKLTDLSGWRFDSVTLDLKVKGPRIAVRPSAAPLVYDFQSQAYLSSHIATVQFDAPRYVHSILAVNRGPLAGVLYWQGEDQEDFIPSRVGTTPTAEAVQVLGKINKIQDVVLGNSLFPGEPRLLVNNEAMGLAVSSAEDRLLHRAPQTLSAGQSAITPNLAETLNAVDGDAVTLNLMSQSDCVVFITGSLLRRRVAQGFTAEVPETLNLSSWQALMLTPQQAAGGGAQTTAVSGSVRKTGPERLGLTESTTTGHQILRAHPRLRLVQPFQPFAVAGEAPVTLTGLWLLLSEPPAEEGRLTVQIATWDPRRSIIGDPLARKTATLMPGLSEYETGPNGLIAAWIPFDEPWVIDPDQQALLHVITLSEIDATIPLVETALAHSQLSPALFRDAGRTEALSERKFAGNSKALLFDLGREDELAELVISSGGTATSVSYGTAAENFSVTLPHGSVVLASRTSIEIEGLAAETTTAPVT